MKVYHDCVNSVILDGRIGITGVHATPVIDAWLISSKLFPSMNDGTPDDTLFDNSGTPGFTIWHARSHIPYFSEAEIRIWSSRELSLIWKSWGILPLLENCPYLTTFWQFKICSNHLLLDDAFFGRLLVSAQWYSTLSYAFWKDIKIALWMPPVSDYVPSSLSKLSITP